MKRSAYWGLLLLLVGALLLLQNFGYLDFLGVSVWQLLWPIALIGLGVWVLVGSRRGTSWDTEYLDVGIEDISQADIHIDFGAGELKVGPGTETSSLLAGSFDGVDKTVRRDGALAKVRLSSPSVVFTPLQWGVTLKRVWDVHLTDRIPITVAVKSGACDARLDLERLKVTALHIDSGASSTAVTLPANAGYTEVRGSSGAASVSIRVPQGVAARIHTSGALASTSVDQRRFPRSGSDYISPDYETAPNKVDIRLDMGVGSIDIS